MPEPTQAYLREVMNYDPETGEFTWTKKRRSIRVGDPCGRVNIWGYREIGVCSKLYPAHRLAFLYMTGRWPEPYVDHINRVRSDNRWCNLREATASENSANGSLRGNNTSGLMGVVWDKARSKWRAQIRINGRKTNLGRFHSAEEAAAAHDRAARAMFGEFAHLNAANTNSAGLPAPAEAGEVQGR